MRERKVHWPPTEKSWPHFRPSAGPWPRLGHNFANDLAVSIGERHSALRFIAAERWRGRVKRRARGGLGRVGFLLSTFHVVHHSMIPGSCALALDRKKLAAFLTAACRFLQFP